MESHVSSDSTTYGDAQIGRSVGAEEDFVLRAYLAGEVNA
jgi:hypothetical protein